MKERPILFTGPMVRALLDGSKTQTRRVAKPVRHPDLGNICTPGALVLEHEPKHVIERACPYGQSGDRLWVRETFANIAMYRDAQLFADRQSDFTYRASGDNIGCHKWQPSIRMPRAASRITLEITSVRMERLQDIREADARAEGVAYDPGEGGTFHVPGIAGCASDSAADAFRKLWQQINRPGSWDANPWVWVVEFKRLEGDPA